jgi:Alr-MurF fusion protein
MYPIQQIANITNGFFLQNADKNTAIEFLTADSRHITSAHLTLFFALTAKRDGHEFIKSAYQQGVCNFIISKKIDVSLFPNVNIILVENTWAALQRLATFHRQQFHLKTIGITGSNGKTIVKEWLFALLSKDETIVRSPFSYNSQVGVPLSVWEIKPYHTLGIFEAGISQTKEMEKIAPIIRCDIGIFTNIGAAHSDGFVNDTEKVREKARLFATAKTIIYCKDYALIAAEMRKMQGKRLFTWSQHTEADLQITHIDKQPKHITVIFALFKQNNIQITIPFSDAASIENAIHCWATMLYLGYDNAIIQRRMPSVTGLGMRLELKNGINHCLLINDSYTSDLTSLSIALNFLAQQSRHTKRTALLSDVLQSGKDDSALYRQIAEMLLSKKINRFIGIGKGVQSIFPFLNKGIEAKFYDTTEDFLAVIDNKDFADETILIKGARIFAFERIVERLAQKAHKTVLEINLNAVVHNLHFFKARISPQTKVMAMVKAAAYGVGSIEIAKLMEYQNCDYLCVAYADEAVELRNAGVTRPIMVLNAEEAEVEVLLRHRLEPEIFSFTFLQNLLEELPENTKHFPIHIKLDTGMKRLGFEEKDLPKLVKILENNAKIHVVSIFSHLVASFAPEHDDFTHHQAEVFNRCFSVIKNTLGYAPMRHLLNSAGIYRFPAYQYEMVRLGGGLYGEGRISNPNLRAVQSLKATISQIKDLPKGETVGYNRLGKLDYDAKIATVSIGYADGLPRAAGNGKYSLYIKEQPAPIVGNVCMDMCMTDVTHIAGVREGEEVLIFGDAIPVEKLAKACETISYEIFTGISPRVKRVYVQE